jgi:Holliday junction resolvase RusA-like endonuclease
MNDERFIVLVYPLPPAQNKWDSMHWSARSEYKKTAKLATIAQISEIRKLGNPGRIRISVFRYSKTKPCDVFNAISGIKGIVDCIVETGLVKDDGPKYVEAGKIFSGTDKKNPRIVLIIEALEAPV